MNEETINKQVAIASIKALYPDMPIVDIMDARRKWREKYAAYIECENIIRALPPVTSAETVTEFADRCRECGSILGRQMKQKMCFDGMTNGEVIDLLFPGADIYHNRDFTLREMIFPDKWWDAPYKAESEDKKQVVIDISEDVYTRLFDNGMQDNEITIGDVREMARAIRLGTPIKLKSEVTEE